MFCINFPYVVLRHFVSVSRMLYCDILYQFSVCWTATFRINSPYVVLRHFVLISRMLYCDILYQFSVCCTATFRINFPYVVLRHFVSISRMLYCDILYQFSVCCTAIFFFFFLFNLSASKGKYLRHTERLSQNKKIKCYWMFSFLRCSLDITTE